MQRIKIHTIKINRESSGHQTLLFNTKKKQDRACAEAQGTSLEKKNKEKSPVQNRAFSFTPTIKKQKIKTCLRTYLPVPKEKITVKHV